MTTAAYWYGDPYLDSAEPPDWPCSIDRLYQDWGDRLQLDQLFTDCRAGLITSILVRHLGELGDSLAEVSDRLALLEQLGIPLTPLDNDQPPAGGLERSQMIVLFRQLQQQQRGRTIQRGHAKNRVNALPPPGKAPYGYRRGKDRYVIDRSTAPIVKALVEHFLLYGTLRGSVRQINQQFGKKFSVSTGRRWLTSPIYRGDLQYHTGDVISDTHAALISRDEAAQIDRLMRRNRRLPPKTASAPRSLAGLVTCQTCQSGMTVTRVTRRQSATDYLYLRPMACPRLSSKCSAIAYGEVLDQAIHRICQDLPAAIAALELPDIDGLQQAIGGQIAVKQDILQRLPTLVEQGILDDQTASLRSYTLKTELSALRDRQAQLPPANLKAIAQTLSIPQFWHDLSESERRVYFREFIDQIHLIRSEEDPQSWSLDLDFIFQSLYGDRPLA
ncbi:MAG: recombinase family protein [Leptolyngbya sp. DLM2.Bin15]|nr:MAG: recombinase family protein [Leptolyngbya sp. DLM2.Bin15]